MTPPPALSTTLRTRRVQLVAFDLDGTLVRGTNICEALASRFGYLPRMREIEHLRTRHLIAAARHEMLAWYGTEPLDRLCDDLSGVELAPGAAEAFELLASREVRTAIVSINWTFAVAWFARRLGADAWVGTAVDEQGAIEHFWPEDKPRWVAAHAAELGLSLADVAAVGDSWGDVPMLAEVGHPIFVGAELPAELPGAVHAAGADLRSVVEELLAR